MATHAIGKTFVNGNHNVRQCSECKRLFELNGDNFGVQKYTMRERRVKTSRWHSMCRGCWNRYERQRYADRKSEQKIKQTRNTYYMRMYGLTSQQVDEMLEKGCMVCGTTDRGVNKNSLHIDHCHTTQRVRGCLCVRCNQALGHMRDNPELIRRLADYLEGKL